MSELFNELSAESAILDMLKGVLARRGLGLSNEDCADARRCVEVIQDLGSPEVKDTSLVREIYDYWLDISGETKQECRLTDKRRKLISRYLKHFGVRDLKAALLASHQSNWHRQHQQSGLRGKWFRSIEEVERMLLRSKAQKMIGEDEPWV